MRKLFLSILVGLTPLGHLHSQTASPIPQIFRSGGKNRIVFDLPPESTTSEPAPSPTPEPRAEDPASSETPALPPPHTPTPTPTPDPSPTPAPGPTAAPLPTPQPAPLDKTPPTPAPRPLETPPARAIKLAAESTPAPEEEPPVVAEAPPAPAPPPPPAPPAGSARSDQQKPVVASAPEPPSQTAPAGAPTPAPATAEDEPPPTPPTPAEVIAETAREDLTPDTRAAQAAPAPEGELPGRNVVAEAENLDLAPLVEDQPPSPSQSVTVNLIRKLVEKGILTKQDAEMMIRQAEAEAEVARAQAQSDMFAIAQLAAAQAAAEQAAIESALNAPAEETVSVTYIPEPVRTQIKEDIKSEILLAGGGAGSLASAPKLPWWVESIKPFGDIRTRFESIVQQEGNDATGAFPNFNAINTGLPFDVTGNQFAPQLNADQNRDRFRLRARVGFSVDLPESFSMGFRLATGNDNSPVSTNQSLGAAPGQTGQGGQFSKYAVWLDRAFLKYTLWGQPERAFEVWVGRFDNPFFSTDLIWDDDLGFDGIAGRLRYEIFRGFRPFITGGAFPVFNTNLNFSTNQPAKFASYNKYLYAAQLGFDWNFARDWNFKFATAYYHFQNIEGKLSSPFTPLSQNDAGDTDDSRPSFAQKGNTYFPIRNIVPDASNDFGAINQWQYYGLATKFQELAFTARLDYTGWKPAQVSLFGEFVTNLAWNYSDINAIAVNNRGEIDPNDIDDLLGDYEGSRYAWLAGVEVGMPKFTRRWDWLLSFGYRWIGSDAVVDGFNDSDFGLGGTNMRGFTAAAALALSPNVWVRFRWLGSDSLAGPQWDMNIFQVDLNGKF